MARNVVDVVVVVVDVVVGVVVVDVVLPVLVLVLLAASTVAVARTKQLPEAKRSAETIVIVIVILRQVRDIVVLYRILYVVCCIPYRCY